MDNKLFQRAEMFASYATADVLFIVNPFNDGIDYWFLSFGFTPANPSNHIHVNELTKGKCLNTMMNNNSQYDQQLFLTQLEQIDKSSLVFPQSVKWVKIR